jgi:putative transposase
MGKTRTKGRERASTANGNGALITPVTGRVHLEIALDQAREDLLGLATRSGLEILAAMLERDRERIVGPSGCWSDSRDAYRYGYDEGAVVMGGRKVQVPKPRVRAAGGGGEIVLPTWEWATREDPLDRRTMQQMLVGVSTRSYAKSLEPPPPGVDCSVAVSRSSVSRRFVAQTKAKVEEFLGRSLADIDVRVVMIDGTWLGEHLMLVVLGIDAGGEKHVLGVREGTTENEGVCRSLLSELVERGLSVEQARLFVIDGGKGIRKAIRSVFGVWAIVQRCQVHKMRNVLQHLPDRQQASVRAAMRGAWSSESEAAAKRKLNTLARQLETRWPSAAASLREGLDETLTVLALGTTGALYRTLRSTNPIENLQSLFKRVTRRVTRWQDGTMARRWAVTGLLEAATRFRRIRGHADLRRLVAALDARCGAVASDTDNSAQAAETAA